LLHLMLKVRNLRLELLHLVVLFANNFFVGLYFAAGRNMAIV
jgi:hypothetical protein